MKKQRLLSFSAFGFVVALFVLSCQLLPVNSQTFQDQEPNERANDRKPFLVAPTQADPDLKTEFDLPSLIIMPRAVPRSELVVYLPGTQSAPRAAYALMGVLAAGGFRAISLMYNNIPGEADVCGKGKDLRCAERFRQERAFGNVPDAEIQNSPEEAIVVRLVRLLRYLQRTQPGKNWDQYLTDDHPVWSRIILAGHSQGAGMVAYLAKKFAVARVVCFSGPADGIAMQTPGRKLSPWQWAPSRTPPERWYGEYNPREIGASNLVLAYRALRIPPNHILAFDLDLPPGVRPRPALYHVGVVSDPRYIPRWKNLFGITEQPGVEN